MTYASINFGLYACEIIGLLLFFTEIFILALSKKPLFRSAFFLIFISTGFSDLIYYIGAYVVRLRAIFDWQPWSTDLVSFSLFLYGALFLSHFVGNALIALNRFTSIYFPTLQNKVWRTRNTLIISAFRFVLSILPQAHLVGQAMDWKESNGTFVFLGYPRIIDFANRVIYAFGSATLLFFTLILNIYTMKALRQIELGAHFEQKQKQQDRNLTLFCFCSTASSIVMCGTQCGRAYGEYTENKLLAMASNTATQWVMVILVFQNPISMWVFCTDFRKECYKKFGFLCGRKEMVLPMQTMVSYEPTSRMTSIK